MPPKRPRKAVRNNSIPISPATITLGDKQALDFPIITPSIKPLDDSTPRSAESSYPLEPLLTTDSQDTNTIRSAIQIALRESSAKEEDSLRLQ